MLNKESPAHLRVDCQTILSRYVRVYACIPVGCNWSQELLDCGIALVALFASLPTGELGSASPLSSENQNGVRMKKISVGAILLLGAMSLAHAMDVSSPTIRSGAQLPQEHVFSGFGCSGKNISPALSWSSAPKGTKSFAITMYDPDAPTGSGWWHWLVFNIPAGVNAIAAGASKTANMPTGAIEVRNDSSSTGFMGACPPSGAPKHRYQVTIWALKDKLPLDADASPAMVGFYLNAMSIEKTTVTAVYGR